MNKEEMIEKQTQLTKLLISKLTDLLTKNDISFLGLSFIEILESPLNDYSKFILLFVLKVVLEMKPFMLNKPLSDKENNFVNFIIKIISDFYDFKNLDINLLASETTFEIYFDEAYDYCKKLKGEN